MSEARNNIEFIIKDPVLQERYSNSRNFFLAQEYDCRYMQFNFRHLNESSIPFYLTCKNFAIVMLSLNNFFRFFFFAFECENDSVIVQMTEITRPRTCFSPRPLSIIHVPGTSFPSSLGHFSSSAFSACSSSASAPEGAIGMRSMVGWQWYRRSKFAVVIIPSIISPSLTYIVKQINPIFHHVKRMRNCFGNNKILIQQNFF